MKIQSAVLLIFLTAFAHASQAGTIEIAQWVPVSFLKTELKKIPIETQTNLPQLNLTFQEWTPKASGVEFKVSGSLTDVEMSATGLQAVAENVSARLALGQLAIDQVLTREIAGNTIQVRVQAVCQPIEIRIPSFSVAVNAEFQKEENFYNPKLSQVRLMIPPESWAVSHVTCQGPQGLDQQIANLIQTTLSRPAVFQDLIRDWLSPHLSEQVRRSWSQLTEQNWQSLKVHGMSPPSDLGLFLLGQIDVSGNAQIQLPPLQPSAMSDRQPQLVLSTEGFKALAQENQQALQFTRYNIQQIAGFSRLMKNRFFQFFVWPDLLHFSRSAPFYLSTDSKLSKMDLVPQGSGQWLLKLQAGGVLQVEKRGAVRDYLRWGLGATSSLATEIKDSRLILTTKNSGSKINWSFDSQYVRDFQPNTWISNTVFNEASKALFQDRSYEKQLPIVQWKNRVFKLNNWVQKADLILLDWTE